MEPTSPKEDPNGPGNERVGRRICPYSAATPRALERDDWNLRYGAKDFLWTVEANRSLMHEVISLVPGRALDLAAGEGRNAVWLAEQGWMVDAVDFSGVAIEKGKQLARARMVTDKVQYHEADLRQFEPIRHGYDLVLLAYLQVQLEVLIPILHRAASAVTPGGVLLVIAHDSSNLQFGYGGPRHPAMLYSPEQVISAIWTELYVEKAERTNRDIPTANGVRVAIDCLVKARRSL